MNTKCALPACPMPYGKIGQCPACKLYFKPIVADPGWRVLGVPAIVPPRPISREQMMLDWQNEHVEDLRREMLAHLGLTKSEGKTMKPTKQYLENGMGRLQQLLKAEVARCEALQCDLTLAREAVAAQTQRATTAEAEARGLREYRDQIRVTIAKHTAAADHEQRENIRLRNELVEVELRLMRVVADHSVMVGYVRRVQEDDGVSEAMAASPAPMMLPAERRARHVFAPMVTETTPHWRTTMGQGYTDVGRPQGGDTSDFKLR